MLTEADAEKMIKEAIDKCSGMNSGKKIKAKLFF
jgi:predicted RNase H-like HicB family nuclease